MKTSLRVGYTHLTLFLVVAVLLAAAVMFGVRSLKESQPSTDEDGGRGGVNSSQIAGTLRTEGRTLGPHEVLSEDEIARLLAEDNAVQRFRGWINGVYVADEAEYDREFDPRFETLCETSSQRWAGHEEIAADALSIGVPWLPPGAFERDGPIAIACGDEIKISLREFILTPSAGSLIIRRARDWPLVSASYPEHRVGSSENLDRPVVLVPPIHGSGLGSSAIVFTFGEEILIVGGEDVSLADLKDVARSVVEMHYAGE